MELAREPGPGAANAKLRAQAAAVRPRVTEIRRALAQIGREIANYTRAVARGDFGSLETALQAAEHRRTALQAEVAQLAGNGQPAAIQLTPADLERHLQGSTEKLRSGENGKVREGIQRAIRRILVGVDGRLTIEVKPGGLLGLDSDLGQTEGPAGRALIETNTLTVGRRKWNVVTGS